MKKDVQFDINKVLSKLRIKANEYKTPIVELIETQTNETWKVLIAAILSARTPDAITSNVCTSIFKKVNTINDFRVYSISEIEKMIFPVGFYRNKAKFLHALPDVLQKLFNGKIPDSVDKLVKLPGVGRKTANLVVSVGFHKPAICVDTHVHRIMNIWGYVKTKTPHDTEMALRKKLPKCHWITVNYLLVSHGQSTCRPISPHCDECVLKEECPKINVKPKKLQSTKHTFS
ncbi:MAG: endonuclease III [Chitinispirillia bacterium]|jgi:endonuclease III